MTLVYAREETLSAGEFVDVLERSGLAARRPVKNERRIAAMLKHANLIVTARDEGAGNLLVGVSRCLTDFSFCCYCSDLAVDAAYQGRGVGAALLAESRKAAGDETFFFLLSAPAAMEYYPTIGMAKLENAFGYPRSDEMRTS